MVIRNTNARPGRGLAGVLALVALVALAVLCGCVEPAPDLGLTAPVRAEDTRLMVLVREADRVGERDGREAARMLREAVVPRARANARRAAALRPRHPRAQALTARLAELMEERTETLVTYAAALESDEPAALLAVIRRQRHLEEALIRLDDELEGASRERPRSGCSRE